jgi:hypothetical protein
MLPDSHLDFSAALSPLRLRLLCHPLYNRLRTVADVAIFMEHHVFAVWDFMSLLKALQIRLTCTQVPWVPAGNGRVRRLVNEIVLGEESDMMPDGTVASHFELYLQGMLEAGADTKPVQSFISQLSEARSVAVALGKSIVPAFVKDFVLGTFSTIEGRQAHEIAAAFTYGREDLVPGMFHELVAGLETAFPSRLSVLRYYLDRHIQLDGDEHGEMGRRMVSLLCGDSRERIAEAQAAAVSALESRLRLWDGIAAILTP